jgi:hypothetical protein
VSCLRNSSHKFGDGNAGPSTALGAKYAPNFAHDDSRFVYAALAKAKEEAKAKTETREKTKATAGPSTPLRSAQMG